MPSQICLLPRTPFAPRAAHTAKEGAGQGRAPVGLALSLWEGCSCWMPAESWLGMWMVVA